MKSDKRISEELERLLQNQIMEEEKSARIYRRMGNICNIVGYFNAEKFFKKHAGEEMEHREAMENYLLDRNCLAETPELPEDTAMYSSLIEMLMAAYDHEKYITGKLEAIYQVAYDNKDYVSVTFISKYVGEQREEEALFNDIIATFEKAGDNMAAILLLESKLE